MLRKGITLIFIHLFLIQAVLSQGMITLKADGKLRNQQSPTAKVIATIPKGIEIKSTNLSNGYYLVEYQGKTGYISKAYIQEENSSSTPSSNIFSNDTGISSQATLVLTMDGKLRKESSVRAEEILTIPKGAKVINISYSKGYYKVEYNGRIGYLYEDYFKPVQKSSNITKYSAGTNSSTTNTWNEYKLKEFWGTNGFDEIEGIYEAVVQISPDAPKYKLGIKKEGQNYRVFYLGGANSESRIKWSLGDTKAILSPTATSHLFKSNWYMSDKSVNTNVYLSFDQGYFKSIWPDGGLDEMYIKLYPTPDIQNSNKLQPSSGTGFAISTNGLIVTNYHVIEGGKKITVKGINNDFSRTYSARVLASDKKNDLAIIKIDDYGFSSFGTIPYSIKPISSEVGESIFVLGYPLRATMGDEVKLTNGIISSKSGFQGDITSYQISAPVQPGNSGGPLFDSKGQLIGIINAKHSQAENASYAIKTSLLFNLLESLDNKPILQSTGSIQGKSLSQQVQEIKKFVFIIESK